MGQDQITSDMFQLYTPARSLRSVEKNLLVIPTVKTKHGEASLSCYAAQLWNQLPDDIKGAPTVAGGWHGNLLCIL